MRIYLICKKCILEIMERDWRNNLQEIPFAFICVFLNVKIHDRKSVLPECR